MSPMGLEPMPSGILNVEYYKSKPRWCSGKIYGPGNPSLSLKRVFCVWKFHGIFSVYFVGRISEAAMGGPRSSFWVRRRSVGCSVAQKGAA